MSSGEEKSQNSNVNGEEKNEKSQVNTTGQGPRNNLKNKLGLIALGVLCGVAAVVLIVFAVNVKNEKAEADELVLKVFEEVQEQFETEVFLEESDGKIISWKDDYTDLDSPESKKLINNLKSKMIMSMEEEGLSAEDIEVTELASAPPRTKTKKRVDEAEFVKRNKEFLTGKDGGLKPPPLKTKEIKEETKNVIAKFRTMARPSKNAAAFASGVSSSMPLVTTDIANRMRSNGLKTSNLIMQAAPKFVDVINKTIEIAHQNPPGIVTVAKLLPKVAQVIECGFNPEESFRNGMKQVSVICKSACLVVRPESLIGGKDSIFHTTASTCISAYFIGLMEKEGGILELMNMGAGPLGMVDRNDPKTKEIVYYKRIVITDESYYKDDYEWEDRYLIKYVGPRIVATTPKASTVVPPRTEFSVTSNPFVVTTTRETPKTPEPVPDPQMYMILQYTICCEGFKLEYNQEGSEAREKLERSYVEEIKIAFAKVCSCKGTFVENVTFVEAEKVEDKELEALVTFRVNVVKKFAKCVVDQGGEVFDVLELKSRDTVGALITLQYGRGLEKEIESEKLAREEKDKEGGWRKRRSVGYLKRKVLRRLAKKTANNNVV